MLTPSGSSCVGNKPLLQAHLALEKTLASRILWRSRLGQFLTFQTPYGYKLRFHPSADSCAMWENPRLKAADIELLLSFLKHGDTFVDIGANIGTLTLAAAVKVGVTGKVYAIEACPRTFRYLNHNVNMNGAGNVQLMNAAVSDEPGTLTISETKQDDMNHVGSGRTSVPAITLDSLMIPGPIALVKSDTEGFEPKVIAGGLQTLKRANAVIIECSEWNMNRYGNTTADMARPLRGLGFNLYTMKLEPLPDDYIGHSGGNIVCLRR